MAFYRESPFREYWHQLNAELSKLGLEQANSLEAHEFFMSSKDSRKPGNFLLRPSDAARCMHAYRTIQEQQRATFLEPIPAP